MKILHFADLHLGVETYGRPDPDTGLSSRLLDFLAALDRVVDYAIENRSSPGALTAFLPAISPPFCWWATTIYPTP